MARQVHSANVLPAEITDHGTVIGGEDAVDRLATQCGTFDQHVLIFLTRPEEDVVDSLVD